MSLSKIEEIKAKKIASLVLSRKTEDSISVHRLVETSRQNLYYTDIYKTYPAPQEWNFFKTLNENKQNELKLSIIKHGLLEGVILWENDYEDNTGYMILSGHNRIKALKELYEKTKDENYKFVKSIIYRNDELTIEQAKEIIIDANFISRDLTTAEKTKCIIEKYKILTNLGTVSNVAARIAEDLNLSDRQVYRYNKLDLLIDDFKRKIDDGSLSMRNGLKLATMSKVFQKKLYNEYGEYLDNKVISRLNIKGDEADIIKQLNGEYIEEEKIVFNIPKEKVEEFKKYCNDWFNNNLSN